MKKLLFILVALALAASAFAGGKTETTTTKPAAEQPKAAAEQPAAAAKPVKNPDTFTYATIGDIATLDPGAAYDNASAGIIQNIYENLIQYDGSATDKFVPVLATSVPTVANGGISKDGLTYTFTIRKGVKFHSGSDLTPDVVRYSIIRHMITDPDGGPMWLVLQPLTGETGTRDGDGKIAMTWATLSATVTVSGDNVVFHLKSPAPAFMAILCGTWASIIDKDFAAKNGDWDGTEATWQKFNNPATGKEPLYTIASGTGPFKLDRWEKGSEVVMVRNETYWGKKPAMAKVIVKNVGEWSTRKLMFLQGDADIADIAPADYAAMDAEQGLTVYRDLKDLGVRAINFNQKINVQDNPYVYSGKLDGQGIPTDFFADKNIRLAMNYAWDEKTYLKEILAGHGADVVTPVVEGLPFYNPDLLGKRPAFDLTKAAAAFKAAFGGQVWEKGFKVDFLYNTGNTTREQSMKMLAEAVMKINPKFQVEVRGVEWATFLLLQREKRLPIFYIGWGADFPDPDNFVNPYMYSPSGTYAKYAGYVNAEADKLIEQGAVELDAAKRKVIYFRLQDIWLEDIVGIVQHQPIGNRYFRDWVKGYVWHPMENLCRYAQFEKKY